MEDGGVDISVQLRHVCLEYPFSTLQAATHDFAKTMQLGEGSAGTVFKAEMQDGSYAAVKVIDLASLGDMQAVAGFEEEVMILSKFRHPNVVVLMGWAREGAKRFLIYEFLPGGDVCGRLNKCKDGRSPFLWYERLAVARDAAMGLAHLHNATPHAFHRDVKSANILLGASGAKIADFGLSVVGKTRNCAAFDCEFPSGTPGYTCPNYITSGKMTEGSEVYSFGMVLLEMLINMLPAGMMGEEYVYPLQDLIMPMVPGAVDRAANAADPSAGWPVPVAREVAALGLACIDGDESRRPCFNEICRLLRFLQEQFPPTCFMGAQPQGHLTQAAPAPTGHALPMPGPVNVPVHTLPPGVVAGPAAAPGMIVTHQVRPPPMPGPPVTAVLGPGQVCVANGTLGPGLLAATGAPGPARAAPGTVMPGWTMGPGRPVAPPGHGQFQVVGRAVGPTAVCLSGQPLPAAAPGGVVIVHPGAQVPSGPPLAPAVVAPAAGPPAAGPPAAGPPAAGPAAGPPAGAPQVPVEVMLEVAHVHGAQLGQMRPEFRMLPLLPAVDADERRKVIIGRQYQPHYFEKVLLDQNDLTCISREAFELTWGGPDPTQAALQLRVLGSNIILVEDIVVRQGAQAPLRPGSRITFAFEANAGALYIILAFLVHCAPQLASPAVLLLPGASGPPGAAATALHALPVAPATVLPGANVDAGLPVRVSDPHQVAMAAQAALLEQEAALEEHTWHLECIFAAGLAPEAFWALPSNIRTLALPLAPGTAPNVLGRSNQGGMFEALLSHDSGLLQCISRRHVQLEVAADEHLSINSLPADLHQPSLLVTNLSQNLIVASRVNLQPLVLALNQGDSAQLHDGDTLSFATEQHRLLTTAAPIGPEASGAATRTTLNAVGDEAGDSSEIVEDHVSVVPFLTMRVNAPAAPPPPSPFVMMSPPSLSVAAAPPETPVAFREDPDLPEEGSATPARLSARGHSSTSPNGITVQSGGPDMSSPEVRLSCGTVPTANPKASTGKASQKGNAGQRQDECSVQ